MGQEGCGERGRVEFSFERARLEGFSGVEKRKLGGLALDSARDSIKEGGQAGGTCCV